MRALIQRVSRAKVTVEGQETGKIDGGFVILLGVTHDDTEAIADRMWQKISQLRIFRDDQGKTNISLRDVAGQVLIAVSYTHLDVYKRQMLT